MMHIWITEFRTLTRIMKIRIHIWIIEVRLHTQIMVGRIYVRIMGGEDTYTDNRGKDAYMSLCPFALHNITNIFMLNF